MSSVISVEQLSKKYVIRHQQAGYSTIRDAITANAKKAVSAPFRWLTRSGEESIRGSEEFWALRDVSFNVNEGERLGIIGRNGAGKSTLLKILSRITEPTKGRIGISGRVSSLLEVGTGFHPELTGRENIFLNGAILGMRSDEVRRKFDQIVAFSEVERFLDTPVKRYSSGMYVRLAFGVAAHLEPDVLIVDEVLAVGDAEFQKKCLGRMDELSKAGRTILFVTHNMDAMQSLCSRAIVLQSGQVVFDGSPVAARQHYIANASANEYSVENNAGRGGAGGVRVKSVWVSRGDEVCSSIESASKITFNVVAEVDEALRSKKDIDVSFSLDAIDGTRLYTVISSWTGSKLDASSGTLAVACDVETMPLVPGKYLLNATIINRGETLDCVLHCASFEVFPNNRDLHIERMRDWGALDLVNNFRNIEVNND